MLIHLIKQMQADYKPKKPHRLARLSFCYRFQNKCFSNSYRRSSG